MKGVILAAGKGSRLYPATRAIPKPILPIANRPTIHFAFDRLKEVGITDICVVVGENEEQMRAALGDGSSQGVSLTYVRQTDPLGLAHAIGFAKDFVGQDAFMLYLGDAMYDQGFQKFVDLFNSTGAANLNLVKHVDDPSRFGVANLDGDRIIKLVEKPKQPESNWAMAGMYIFGPQIWSVLPDLKPSARGEYEITDAIQMLVDRGELVVAGKYDGVWFDTGTLDSYLETSRFVTDNGLVVAPDATFNGHFGDHVVIGAGAHVVADRLEDCVILPGANVIVVGEIRHAILGGTVVTSDSIENAIVYDNTWE